MKKSLTTVFGLSAVLMLCGACGGTGGEQSSNEQNIDPTIPQEVVAIPFSKEIKNPQLLNEAKWIWIESDDNNTFVDFRKTFDLSSVPTEARTEIAVENKYFLYVNGQQVVYDGGLKRGASKTDGYFDVADIAKYLKVGKNTISVKAWFYGAKGTIGDITYQSYSNTPIAKPGFIFASKIGDTRLASDASWKAFKDDAYKTDTDKVQQPNLRFPEYNVYYEASDKKDAGFESESFDDSSWNSAAVKGSYGDAPWNNLQERPIPLFVENGLQEYKNSTEFEGKTTTKTEEITVKLPYNAQVTPYLKVESSAKTVITIKTDNTDKAKSLLTTFVTSGNGVDEWESPSWVSGESITYSVPAGVKIISLKYRESGYDTEIDGEFKMGNEFYDDLWTMGARTHKVCIRDNYMDCPDRERAAWCGDSTLQMRESMYALNPKAYSLFNKMMSQKANYTSNNPDDPLYRLLPTVTPIDDDFYELPAQEMSGIVGIWDYYLYTGDVEPMYDMYEPALNYLNIWNINKTGLVKHKTGKGLNDWQDTAAGVDTKVQENAWYYWSLDTIRKMGIITGHDTTEVETKMTNLKNAYQSLWVEGVGYSSDTDHLDDRGNALAVLSGLAGEDKYETINNLLKTTYKASTYMESYVLEAMCKMGYTNDALERMNSRFSPMVASNKEEGRTTLWEYWTKDMGTYNHAWSGSPLTILSKYVGGIRPTSGGYATYEVIPTFDKSNTVKAKVESSVGTITLDATKAEDKATIKVTLPTGGAKIGVPKTGSNVTINGSTNDENVVKVGEDESYRYYGIKDSGTYEFESR